MQGIAENEYKLRTLKRSTIAIASVVLVEVILGLVINSLAIVSDGLHALLDALTTFALLIATQASLKPPDEEHMYGHEKFESIGGLIGGIALIGVALLIMYEAILKILENTPVNQELQLAGFIAIGYTFCIDFFRVGSFMKARKSESSTMKAGLFHAVADLSSTVIALLGFGLATLGFPYGDSLASMVLSVLLTYLSVKLVWSNGMELSDATSKGAVNKVRNEILNMKGVRSCEDLKVRRAGNKTFVRATVQVPDYLGLEEAHDLTSEIESNLIKSLGNADVTIHIEPCETEMPTEKLVEKLAMETSGVKGVHGIDTSYADGKLYITLHIYVNPKLTVEEADDMADSVESKIQERVRDVENVTVHIEPYSARKRRGSMVNEDEIGRIIHEAAGSSGVFRIKRIVTYVADNKRYINIDCRFTKQTSVEDAHKIASDIEEKVRAHFAETIVTVHTE
ncbi:cation-efflux pump [Candidatus Bathyarchaeota archaeon]|nr:cation-efflux pump [Candidatus Bathyarchaeota archaeon]